MGQYPNEAKPYSFFPRVPEAPGKQPRCVLHPLLVEPLIGREVPVPQSLAALFARLDANDTTTPAPPAPAKKEMSDYPAPVGPQFRDE